MATKSSPIEGAMRRLAEKSSGRCEVVECQRADTPSPSYAQTSRPVVDSAGYLIVTDSVYYLIQEHLHATRPNAPFSLADALTRLVIVRILLNGRDTRSSSTVSKISSGSLFRARWRFTGR